MKAKTFHPTDEVMAAVQQAPCKPRLSSTPTDKLPIVHREGALDARKLPSRRGNKLVWPCGKVENI